ncbi:MAG TPA: serine/threonine-protein kinase, partial [Gemmatimonadales bacterium]
TRFRTLPREIIEQSANRVRVAALLTAAVWALAAAMNIAAGPQLRALPGTGGWPWPNWLFAAIGVVGSLSVALAAARLNDRPRLVIDIGLGFEVFTAALIAMVSFWVPEPHAARISWTTALILLYPAIAPSPVPRMLTASFAAASMDGVGFGIARMRGLAADWPASHILQMLSSNYACAVLALVPTTLIRRLGREVNAARELGSYRLRRLLGRGGMGEVHEATHRMIARPAAVKLIRPELLASAPHLAAQVAERFHREAEAVAALRSPHTVQLYDFGVAPDGTLYYAMELLDGIDLQRFVERYGRMPPERAIQVLRQTCDSLAEAHARGLIHRDIKPSNIVLCRMGLTLDFVKVLDFGLVRREVPLDGEDKLTRTLQPPGTPSFMAPEVIRNGRTDRRADIYSLGCVAYWLLTGHPVFDGESPVQVMYRHAYDPPRPPSEHLDGELPRDLEEVVLAALAKDPEQRIPDAEEFARRLDACELAGRWDASRAREWWAANRREDAG